MKTGWTPFLMAAAAMAASGAAKHEPDVVVCLHRGPIDQAAIGLAEGEARGILGSAGISLEFALGKPRSHSAAEAIEAELVEQADARFRPDRSSSPPLERMPAREPRFSTTAFACPGAMMPPGHVLAHVLVHEITHVLEGVARHSASGIMKARWEGADYERMHFAPLPFAGEDLRLIHAWWARHHQLAAVVR